jgi:hypothetical protein
MVLSESRRAEAQSLSMTIANRGNEALALAVARKSLDSACHDLDNAVRSIPDVLFDDNIMATPGLVALLLRVVVARRKLNGLELSLGADSTRPGWASIPQ